MMSPHLKTFVFVLPALLVGVCLGLLAWYSDDYSEAIVVKLSITLPLMMASAVDSQYIVRGSPKGDAAFWATLAIQWLAIGYGVCGLWRRMFRKKNDKTARYR